jgi:hypothetical protein
MDRIKELREIVGKACQEIDEIETAERIKENKALVGKCFRYHNCYSCPEKNTDYWWCYRQITGLDEYGDLLSWEFQIDKDGKVEIDPSSYFGRQVDDGWQPITKAQFQKAWDKTREVVCADFQVV